MWLLLIWVLAMCCRGIKGCVNVFGAQQYHPTLQRAMIASYYVNFYLAINGRVCV